MINSIVIAIIIGYFFGSFPASDLTVRLRKGIDLREVGGKIIRAMTVLHEVGRMEAFRVTPADLGKAVGAIPLVHRPSDVTFTTSFDIIRDGITGTAAVAGHIFPVFPRFHSGKGASPATKIPVFLMPGAAPLLFVVFLVALLFTDNPTFDCSLLLVALPSVAGFVSRNRCGEPLASVFYPIGVGVFPGIQYSPRLKEMHNKTSGDWRRFVRRRNLRERY